MGGFYRCPYILRSGTVCNKGCYHPDGNRSRAFYQCQKLAKIQASDEEYSEEYSEEELGLDLFGGGIVRG
ncbi:hypothetical protein RIR_jg14945.t1 [Rhizophagus irregularis DAOM 181602=DAOM 197198]|nr:hypothetical protein RIR_jg14945.t1 [Rhizophagus irregularis DAOM 181602=DAOM 197198]